MLAFPIEDEPAPSGRSPDSGAPGPGSEPDEEPPVLLGDVVICPAVAARNAVAHGVADEDELALLVVHGLLHLLGMDHEVEAEAERWRRSSASCWRAYHERVGGAPRGEAAE